ncbi:hypothetical protein [Shewanella sp.]|uniref:hypothetical protein n=1 Tax=Shewanella sp. TaxID=50422 RepID=UPI00356388C9
MLQSSVAAPDYFLRHFQALCSALSRYRDLLNTDELALLGCPQTLDINALRLLVRLLGRRGSYFRISLLSYADIDDLKLAIEELTQAGFVRSAHAIQFDNAGTCGTELSRLLTKDELYKSLAIVSPSNLPRNSTKANLVEFAEQGSLWPAIWNLFANDVIFVNADKSFGTLKLLYFGNSWQEPSEFVVTELGHREYESYPLDVAHRRFDSRADIDLALFCAEVTVLLEDRKKLDVARLYELENQVLALSATLVGDVKSVSLRRIDKLRTRLGREFERRNLPEAALRLYAGVSLPPARERTIRSLEALQRYHDAFHLAQQTLAAPKDDEEHRACLRMLPRLAKKVGAQWQAEPYCEPLSQHIVLSRVQSAQR